MECLIWAVWVAWAVWAVWECKFLSVFVIKKRWADCPAFFFINLDPYRLGVLLSAQNYK